MSDLAEIRRDLAALREIATTVSTDVAWIKDGMDRGAERIDKHEKRIATVENRLHWYSGIAAAAGALLGIGGSHGLKL